MVWEIFNFLILAHLVHGFKDVPGPYPQACSNVAFSKFPTAQRVAQTYWYQYPNGMDFTSIESFSMKDYQEGTLVAVTNETQASWSQSATSSGTISGFKLSDSIDLTMFAMIQTGYLTPAYTGLFFIDYSDVSQYLTFQIGKGSQCGSLNDPNTFNNQMIVADENGNLHIGVYLKQDYNYLFRAFYANKGKSTTSASLSMSNSRGNTYTKWNQVSVVFTPESSQLIEDRGINHDQSLAVRPLDSDIGVACTNGKSTDSQYSSAHYNRVDWYAFNSSMDSSNATDFALSGYLNGDYVGSSKETTTQWSFSVTEGNIVSPSSFNFKGKLDLAHFAAVHTSFFSVWFGGLYTWKFYNIAGDFTFQYGSGAICGDPRDPESINNNVYSSSNGYLQVCVYVSTNYIFPIRLVYNNNGNTKSALSVTVQDNAGNSYSNWNSYTAYDIYTLGQSNDSPTYDFDNSNAIRPVDDTIPYPCVVDPQTDRKYARVDFFDFPYGNNATQNLTEFSITGYSRGVSLGANKETQGSWSMSVDNTSSETYGTLNVFNYKPSMKLSQMSLVMTSFFAAQTSGLITFEFKNTQLLTFQFGRGDICGDPRNIAAINNNIYQTDDGYLRVTLYILSGLAYPIRVLYVNPGTDKVSLTTTVTDADLSTYSNWPLKCSYYMPSAGTDIEYPDYHYKDEDASRELDDEGALSCEIYLPEGTPSTKQRYYRADWYTYDSNMNNTNITEFSLKQYINGEYSGSAEEKVSQWSQSASGTGSLSAFTYKPEIDLGHFAVVMTTMFLPDTDGNYTFAFSNTQAISLQLGYGTICGDPRNSSAINNNAYTGYGDLQTSFYLESGKAYPMRIVYSNSNSTTTSFSLKITNPKGSTTSNWYSYIAYVLPPNKHMREPNQPLPTLTGFYGPESTTYTTTGSYTNSLSSTTNGPHVVIVEGYKTLNSTVVDAEPITYTTTGPYTYGSSSTSGPHIVVINPTKYPTLSAIPGDQPTTFTTTGPYTTANSSTSGPHVVIVTPYYTLNSTVVDASQSTYTTTGPYFKGNSSTSGPYIVVINPTQFPTLSPIPGDKPTTFTTSGPFTKNGTATTGPHVVIVTPFFTVDDVVVDAEPTTYTSDGPYVADGRSTSGPHIVVVHPTHYPTVSAVPGDHATTYTTDGLYFTGSSSNTGPHVVIVTPYSTLTSTVVDAQPTTYTTNGGYNLPEGSTSGDYIVVIVPTSYPTGNNEYFGPHGSTFTSTGPYMVGSSSTSGPHVVVVKPYLTVESTIVDAQYTKFTTDGPYTVNNVVRTGSHIVVINPTHYPTANGIYGPEESTYTTDGPYTRGSSTFSGPHVIVITPFPTVDRTKPDVPATTYTTTGPYTNQNGELTTGPHVEVIHPTVYPTLDQVITGPTPSTFTTDGPYTIGSSTTSGPHVVIMVTPEPFQECKNIGDIVGKGFAFKLYNVPDFALNSSFIHSPADHLDQLGNPFSEGYNIINQQQIFDYASQSASDIVAVELTGFFIPKIDGLHKLHQSIELVSSLQFGAGDDCSSDAGSSVTDHKILLYGNALQRRSSDTKTASNYVSLSADKDYPVRHIMVFRKHDRASGLTIFDPNGKQLDFSSIFQLQFSFPTIYPDFPYEHPRTYTSTCANNPQSVCVYVTGDALQQNYTTTESTVETFTSCEDKVCTRTTVGETNTTYTTYCPYTSGTVTDKQTHIVVVECATQTETEVRTITYCDEHTCFQTTMPNPTAGAENAENEPTEATTSEHNSSQSSEISLASSTATASSARLSNAGFRAKPVLSSMVALVLGFALII